MKREWAYTCAAWVPLLIVASCGGQAPPTAKGRDGSSDAVVEAPLPDGADAAGLDAPPIVEAGPGAIDAVPDLGTDGDGPTGCDLPATHPLSSFTFPALTLSTDAMPTLVVPDGYLVKGQLTLQGTLASNPYSVSVYATLDGHDVAANIVMDGVPAPTYSIVLPAGTYLLTFEATVNISVGAASVPLTRTVVESLTVCGDAIHDVTLPTIDFDETSKLTLTGLDTLGTSAEVSVYMALSNHDGTFSVSNSVMTSGSSVDFALPTLTASDVYTPFLWITFPSNGQAASLELYPAALTGHSPWTVALPELVELSGSVSNLLPPVGRSGVSVDCAPNLDATAPSWVARGSYPLSGQIPPAYRALVPKGSSCVSSAVVQLGHDGLAALEVPRFKGISPSTFSGSSTKDFAFPTVGADALLSVVGRVTSARGEPLASYYVSVDSQALQQATLAGAEFFTSSAASAGNGSFRISVLAGDYDMRVERSR